MVRISNELQYQVQDTITKSPPSMKKIECHTDIQWCLYLKKKEEKKKNGTTVEKHFIPSKTPALKILLK